MEVSRKPAQSLLLLGRNGQVGSELFHLLSRKWDVIAPRSSEVNLLEFDALRRYVRSVRPRWILNAAAYTAVDRAEAEPQVAFGINADAVRVLAEEARLCGAPVVHFSTDYVFDGVASGWRRESDPTNPLGVYGQSKLAGEQALAAKSHAYFTFRTSWVYSTRGRNFLLTILKLAREREELAIVDDQIGAPTLAADLAKLTEHAIQRTETLAAKEGLSLTAAAGRIGGLYHACGAGETTWFRFAEAFLECARAFEVRSHFARLRPIRTADYPTAARRPANSRLNCTHLKERLSFELPSWQQSVAQAMRELYAQHSVLSAQI